jgi:D-alanyl-D-alanine carboxypeptidase
MPYNTLRRPQKLPRKPGKRAVSIYLIVVIAAFLIGIGAWLLFYQGENALAPGASQDGQSETQTENGAQDNEPAFDKSQHSIDNPASPWVTVNKQRPLDPLDYAPADLVTPDVPLKYAAGSQESLVRQEAARALQDMFAAAEADGLSLLFVSGYRSYGYQQSLFNRYASEMGEAAAEQISARPGHSEHQTGWAADIGAASRECEVETCFGDMPEGQWVAANAHRFGFIVRYPQGLTGTTGFDYEPWHLRYVGKPLAAELNRTNTPTLEQFFNLPAAPHY